MMEFLGSILEFINGTQVPEQFREVDIMGLFSNPWFLLPFLAFIGYNLYKQALNTLVITALAVGVWIFSGSSMMDGMIVNGHLQLGKVFPVVGVGLIVVAVGVYFLFIRGD